MCFYSSLTWCLFVQLLSGSWVSGLVLLLHFPGPALQVIGVFVLQLTSLFALPEPTGLHLIKMSMSDMHNNAWSFLRTTKKFHILPSLLCSTFTLHLLNCILVVQLYVLVWCLQFLLLSAAPLLPKEINFYICIMALCFHHYQCQPDKTLWLWFYVMMFLDLLLLWQDWN